MRGPRSTVAGVAGGASDGPDLISYIGAGLLLGGLLDWWWGTSPAMIVVWALLGVGVGGWRMWQSSASLEEEGRRIGHGA